MAQIQIDWTELEQAFENHAPDIRAYLDKQSGKIHAVSRHGSEDDPIVLQVQAHPTRFIPIDPIASREQYVMMEQFIESANIPILKKQLADSIVGKGAFRRFKDVVSRHAEERKRWFAFRDVLLHRYILDWLKRNQVEAADLPEWSLDLPEPPPLDAPADAAEVPPTVEANTSSMIDVSALKTYLHAWARSHGDEYRFLYGPAAFERLADDLCEEFTFFHRRSKND